MRTQLCGAVFKVNHQLHYTSTILSRPYFILPITSRQYSSPFTPRHDGSPTGLYGFDYLKTPADFQRFVNDAIERSGELVDYISAGPSSSEVVRAMDEISDTVCSVVDSAELCRSTHPDRSFFYEANNATMRINEYLHYLNTNHALYDAVKKAESDSHLLSEEAQRAAHHLRLDFEKGGIHLPIEEMERVNALNMGILRHCQEFGENINANPGFVDIYPASRIPNHLRYFCDPVYRINSDSSRKEEKGFRIVTEPRILNSVLQCVSDEEVRKMAYIKGNSSPLANIEVLEKIVASRHELAQTLGHSSYADFIAKQNMASSASTVKSFLHDMNLAVQSKAVQEFELIKSFKRKKLGQIHADLEPWDETYYTGIMKSACFTSNFSVVSSYFTLANCIRGINIIVKSLFGATFRDAPMAPGESWHPSVFKLSLHHPDEGDLGYLYLDLYSRKDKYPGCANFSIKGCRRISDTEFQLPVVALVCNFVASRTPSEVRLNHWEVETLFHEFGHALHSLLSRTEFQHFSGTRVPLDFAETPSNLFEYFAWDYRVLKTFAKHHTTGEVIPEQLVKSMHDARAMFTATELQRQILYAMADQKIFGEEAGAPKQTSEVVGSLKEKYTRWRHVEGTYWQIRFSHLMNYGAGNGGVGHTRKLKQMMKGYYSYLYAKSVASMIWKSMLEENPFCPQAGEALRLKLLQHGGAKDPANMVNDLLGSSVLIPGSHGGLVPHSASLLSRFHLLP